MDNINKPEFQNQNTPPHPPKNWYRRKGLVSIIIFAVIVVIAISTYCVRSYPIIGSLYLGDMYKGQASFCEQFVKAIAVNFNRSDLCNKISPTSIGDIAGAGSGGYQITLERSDCFSDIALQTNNKNLCSEVKPINTFFLNGSQNNESNCQDGMSTGRTLPLAFDQVLPNGSDLDNMMEKLGYKPADMVLHWYNPVNKKLESLNVTDWDDYIQRLTYYYQFGPDSSLPAEEYTNAQAELIKKSKI